MDELSLLEADSIDELLGAESALHYLPMPDFTGSLDYIDSLPSRSALAVSRRDIANITTATLSVFSSPFGTPAVPGKSDDLDVSPTDFRPLGDARRFDPEVSVRPPRAIVRSSARVVASPIRNDFPPAWRNPLDPDRSTDDLNRVMREAERRIFRRPFANRFERPDRVVICLKRKLRRNIMHAFGFAGKHYVPRHINRWSMVIC